MEDQHGGDFHPTVSNGTKIRHNRRLSILNKENNKTVASLRKKQAGAELGQAQVKLEVDEGLAKV